MLGRIASILAGGSEIDRGHRLRAGETEAVTPSGDADVDER
jgi:hypothetical protein